MTSRITSPTPSETPRRVAHPSWTRGVAVHYRLAWTRMLRSRKLLVGLVAAFLIVAAAIGIRYLSTAEPAIIVARTTRDGFFSMLVFLLPFLFTSGAIAEEVEGRTFTYLALRPSGRVSIVLGKFLAGASMSIAVLAMSMLIIHVGSFVADPGAMFDELPETMRRLGAMSLLATYYSAVCLLWGSIAVETSALLATIHLAIVEFGFASLFGAIRLLSMNTFALALAGYEPLELIPDQPELELALAGGAVAVTTTVFLLISAANVRFSEIGLGRA